MGFYLISLYFIPNLFCQFPFRFKATYPFRLYRPMFYNFYRCNKMISFTQFMMELYFFFLESWSSRLVIIIITWWRHWAVAVSQVAPSSGVTNKLFCSVWIVVLPPPKASRIHTKKHRPAFGGTVPRFHQMSREMRQMSRIFFKWWLSIFCVADYFSFLPWNATRWRVKICSYFARRQTPSTFHAWQPSPVTVYFVTPPAASTLQPWRALGDGFSLDNRQRSSDNLRVPFSIFSGYEMAEA